MADNLRVLRPPREPWSITDHAVPGARFVTPEEYLAGIPVHVRRSMINHLVTQALAAAADPDGVLIDLDYPQFFTTHVAAVLDEGLDADEVVPLTYDRFAATVLIDCIASLTVDHGLLANRGNGDSADFRLTLREEARVAGPSEG